MPSLYVADTHALIWYLEGSPRLGALARQAFDSAAAGKSQIIIPVIVFAEIVFLAERRRLPLDVTKIVASVQATPGFVIEPLPLDVVLAMANAPAIPDIHDRILVCTALHHSARLITRDETITQSRLVETVW